MKLTTAVTRGNPGLALLPFAASAFLIAGCGSSSGSAASATGAVQAAATSSAAPRSSAGPAGTGATAGVTVQAKAGALGTYLTDQTGRTLYLFAADTGSTSTCNAGCTTYWPPLTGTARPGGGVQQSALSSSSRSDGTKQVTYDGHPLYYFAGDKAPGDTSGQGSNGSGARWWVVGVDGKPVTKTAAPSSSATAVTSGTKY